MHNSLLLRAVGGILIGLCVGLLMALPCFTAVEMSAGGKAVFETINSPAIWLANAWTYRLHLPPSGELGAWCIVPATTTIMQWSFIGFLGAVAWALRSRLRNRRHPQP